MTEPTTNPILEKMARGLFPIIVAQQSYWCDGPVEKPCRADCKCEAYAKEVAQAALRSLLPLDEEGVRAAYLSVLQAYDWRVFLITMQDAQSAITAFINHAIGGK